VSGRKPTPTTTETTSVVNQGPTETVGSSTTNTQNNIPAWLEGPAQGMVGRAVELSQTPYAGYDGQRIADFSPLMEQAFDRIGGQQVAGQLGTATGLAGAAGQAAMGAGSYDPYSMGRFTGDTAQAYMDPYMQNVVNSQMREAQREADIATTTRAGAATRAGAFGGSRQAILDAEAGRNLAMQKGDIQATGLQRAFESGRSQFGTEDALREQSRQFGANLGLQGAGQAINAAGVLGQLGQTQFGQEMDITQGLGYAGSLQQAQEQSKLDVDYQDFLAQQRHPYEQVSWLQGVLAGTPHSTTQTSQTESQSVSTPGEQTSTTVSTQTPSTSKPSPISQAVGVGTALYGLSDLASGGVVQRYADGGITGLLSDQQLQQRQQNPQLPTIARLAAEMQAMENAKIRQAGQAAPQPPRPTVAEETLAGLGALPMPDTLVDSRAGGGLLGYAGGGGVGWERHLEELTNPTQNTGLWDALKRGFTYSSDAEKAKAAGPTEAQLHQAAIVERARAAREQSAAETARLAAAGAPQTGARAPLAPTPPSAPPSAGLSALARQVAPQPAAASAPMQPQAQPADPTMPTSMGGIRDLLMRGANDQAQIAQDEADQIAKLEADRLAQFDERQKGAADADKPARDRIQTREQELAAQRKQAKNFAIIRAGLAMMSGESPHALVNIGRGLSKGLEGYAVDTAKIDEAREGLRAELDRLDQLRQQALSAAGEKRDNLVVEMRKAQITAVNAFKKTATAAGVQADNVVAQAAVQAMMRSREMGEQHQYKLGEIQATGAEARRTQAARPVGGGGGASTRGELTQKDLATMRAKAAQEYAGDRLLQRKYPTAQAYVDFVMNTAMGATASPAGVQFLGFE
jgi:hypothetical protein